MARILSTREDRERYSVLFKTLRAESPSTERMRVLERGLRVSAYACAREGSLLRGRALPESQAQERLIARGVGGARPVS